MPAPDSSVSPGNGAERRELPTGGHLRDDKDLDSLYAWLTSED